MQDFPSGTSIRGNKNRSSWCLRRFFHISVFSDDDDDDGEAAAMQTRCNPVFTLCSSDNHFKS